MSSICRTVISDASAGLPDSMVVTVVRADSAEAPAPIVNQIDKN